jgi:hypothetical protein
MVLDETLVVWDVELRTEALECLLYALMTHGRDQVQGARVQVGGVENENAIAMEEKMKDRMATREGGVNRSR